MKYGFERNVGIGVSEVIFFVPADREVALHLRCMRDYGRYFSGETLQGFKACFDEELTVVKQHVILTGFDGKS